MKKMMMAVAFATLMAFSMVMMGCEGEKAVVAPTPKAATPKAATPKVTTGTMTVAPTPKAN